MEEQERKARMNIIIPQGNKKKRENGIKKLERGKKKGVRKKQHNIGKSVIAGMH